MRPLLLLLCLSLASCIDYPSIQETTAEGSILKYNMGRNFMARRKELVADITGPGGRRIRIMEGESDATDVPKHIVNAVVTGVGLNAMAAVSKNAADNATKEVISGNALKGQMHATDAAGAAYETGVNAGAPVGVAIPPGGIAPPLPTPP